MSIFGRKEKDAAPPDTHAGAPEPRSEPEPRAPGSARREGQTTVGPTIKVKGEMVGDEDVTVDGRVEGIVNLNRVLTVGKTGVVEADVRAQAVVIHGRILGNVIAEQRVEIHPSGRLEGNIKSPKISIHEGAHFKGNVDMSGAVAGAPLAAAPAASADPAAASRRPALEHKP